MKLCIECNHLNGEDWCKGWIGKQSPRTGKLYIASNSADIARNSECLCGAEAKWFEPRLPEPGDGYRLLSAEEVSTGRIQSGDGTWAANQWIDFHDDYIGQSFSQNWSHIKYFRRRIIPVLKKCPEGHDVMLRNTIATDDYFVTCSNGGCTWRGPAKRTKELAAEAWNEAMK